MTEAIDLDAYFARIGFRGTPAADLSTLQALHRLHPAAIPFEAIDVLLERGIDLEPAAIEAKLVTAGRGGYCFEQNALVRRALAAIGFEVDSLAARVLWNRPADAPPPAFNHMVLRVDLDGQSWLTDVGFGGRVLTQPLDFGDKGEQHTAHDRYRLVAAGRNTLLQVATDDGWRPVYELSHELCVDADYEQANWFTSTHPESKFRRHLIVARTTPDARYALLDNQLTIRRPGGRIERRTLSADAIERALADTFLLPVAPGWRQIVERAAKPDAPGEKRPDPVQAAERLAPIAATKSTNTRTFDGNSRRDG